VQSDVQNSYHLSEKVALFLKDQLGKLIAMSEEQLQTYKTSLEQVILLKDHNLKEESESHWLQVISHQYQFKRSQY